MKTTDKDNIEEDNKTLTLPKGGFFISINFLLKKN